jgi:hypothetical protein
MVEHEGIKLSYFCGRNMTDSHRNPCVNLDDIISSELGDSLPGKFCFSESCDAKLSPFIEREKAWEDFSMKSVNQEIDSELLAHAAGISRLADKATTRIAKIRLITLTFAIYDVVHAQSANHVKAPSGSRFAKVSGVCGYDAGIDGILNAASPMAVKPPDPD